MRLLARVARRPLPDRHRGAGRAPGRGRRRRSDDRRRDGRRGGPDPGRRDRSRPRAPPATCRRRPPPHPRRWELRRSRARARLSGSPRPSVAGWSPRCWSCWWRWRWASPACSSRDRAPTSSATPTASPTPPSHPRRPTSSSPSPGRSTSTRRVATASIREEAERATRSTATRTRRGAPRTTTSPDWGRPGKPGVGLILELRESTEVHALEFDTAVRRMAGRGVRGRERPAAASRAGASPWPPSRTSDSGTNTVTFDADRRRRAAVVHPGQRRRAGHGHEVRLDALTYCSAASRTPDADDRTLVAAAQAGDRDALDDPAAPPPRSAVGALPAADRERRRRRGRAAGRPDRHRPRHPPLRRPRRVHDVVVPRGHQRLPRRAAAAPAASRSRIRPGTVAAPSTGRPRR